VREEWVCLIRPFGQRHRFSRSEKQDFIRQLQSVSDATPTLEKIPFAHDYIVTLLPAYGKKMSTTK
jgi:hypothetical protein